MRLQFQLLMYIVCLNLATGLVIELNLPGTTVVNPAPPDNPSDYEGHFNATEVADSWTSTPFSGIPVIGDIFAGFNFAFRAISYLIAGFPLFLLFLGNSFIIDAEARVAYTAITTTLCAIFYILMFFYTIDFISGRYHTR